MERSCFCGSLHVALDHGSYVSMTGAEDDEEGYVDESFCHDPSWHAECTTDVLADFLAVGDLILVVGDTLGKCILDSV